MKLEDYRGWMGVWTGAGVTQAGHKALIRTTFEQGLDGFGIAMHFEAWDPAYTTLYHGVDALLAVAPNKAIKAIAHSTIHGPLLLELLPDDEGVMALVGESIAGNRISVTFVEEADQGLLFTAFAMPSGTRLNAEDTPRMHSNLKRTQPFRPAR